MFCIKVFLPVFETPVIVAWQSFWFHLYIRLYLYYITSMFHHKLILKAIAITSFFRRFQSFIGCTALTRLAPKGLGKSIKPPIDYFKIDTCIFASRRHLA